MKPSSYLENLKHLPVEMRPTEAEQVRYLGLSDTVFAPITADRETPTPTEPPLRAFLLLDAAADRDVYLAMNGYSNEATCLFDGAVASDLEMVGPWLVEIEQDDSVWEWFVQKGYGNNWGLIIHSRLELRRLKTQLKKFLKIQDEAGDVFFFKYYRPENFNAHFPEFSPEQRISFIRGIQRIFAETRKAPDVLQQHEAHAGDGSAITSVKNVDSIGRNVIASADVAFDDAFWSASSALENTDAT